MSQGEKEAAIRMRLDEMNVAYDREAPERLAIYHGMLADWNTRMNLTGDSDFEIILNKHMMDSVAPLQHDGLFPLGGSLIDVGSGAGFPGLPLAILRPDLKVALLDSLSKRVKFLQEVARTLGLSHVTAIHARAEEAAHTKPLREKFDVSVARAVAPVSVLCELLLPFVKLGGKMLCYKGPAVNEEIPAGNLAAEKLGGGQLRLISVSLPSLPELRHSLVICEKMEKTVRHYPRKPGTPNRSPLGEFDKS